MLYWSVIAILGTIHLQALLKTISLPIPIYITSLLVVGGCFFLNLKVLLRISSLGFKGNALLFSMQLLLLVVYPLAKPSWIYLVPFLLYLGIELIRLTWSKEASTMSQEIACFEEERSQFNETFRVVRSERHDFLKHISALHFMLEHEKFTESKTYLDELVEGYNETNLSIKGEHGVVAGILHQMYGQARGAGISIVYDLELPLSTLPLADKKIVALLSNLLSNSIDACCDWQKHHGREAQLSLQFYKRSGLYMFICKNSSLPVPPEILDRLFIKYGKTTKSGAHDGLGTKIIHEVVTEHQGFLDFIYKNEEFTVKIKIPAIR